MQIDLITFIKCDGPNIRQDNLDDTIRSLIKTTKDVTHKIYIVINSKAKHWIENITNRYPDFKDLLLECVEPRGTWADDFNFFFQKYQNKAEYILISHDDIEYQTDNFLSIVKEEIKGHEEEVGWIVGTDLYYTNHLGMVIPEGLRPDLYADATNWGSMFHLHKMKNGYDPSLLDYPKRATKICGIMSMMMLIRSENLKKIGPCENWTNYTMLVDPDWCLRALQINMWNIWVPSIFYKHPLRKSLRPTGNKYEAEAHQAFVDKWGFDLGVANSPGLISMSFEELREKYKGTNIPWATYRNSYDWCYLK